MPSMKRTLLPLLAVCLPFFASPPPAFGADETAGAALAACDAAWQKRAEGHRGRQAAPAAAAAAVAACERAVEAQPERLEARAKLLRALHFQGEYAARSTAEKQRLFGRGREVAEGALDLMAKRSGGRAKLDALAVPQAARALSGVPEAAELHLWAGAHWGLWGDAFGKLAAARQGVGDRVRRYAELANALDERAEHAGGHRLLGRLHSLAPKVPLVTGWVDRGKAVAELRRAMALAPDFPLNALWLAEALLEHAPDQRNEAREILKRLAARPPAPDRAVEDEDVVAEARALLGKAG